MNANAADLSSPFAPGFPAAAAAEPMPTPVWVSELHARLGELLIARHHIADGPTIALARSVPQRDRRHDETATAAFLAEARARGLVESIPGWSGQARQDALAWWRAWRVPPTEAQPAAHRDPGEPDRPVRGDDVERIIRLLADDDESGSGTPADGAIPAMAPTFDAEGFVALCRNDPDWLQGGASVASVAMRQALGLYHAINRRADDRQRECLASGLTAVMRHQSPPSGLWGRPRGPWDRRVTGTFEVVVGLWTQTGAIVPGTLKLSESADMLARSGRLHHMTPDAAPQAHTAALIAFCLEVEPTYRPELLEALTLFADRLPAWVTDEGGVTDRRGEPGGALGAITAALGVCGAWLNWTSCPFPNPLADARFGRDDPWRLTFDDGGEARLRAADQA